MYISICILRTMAAVCVHGNLKISVLCTLDTTIPLTHNDWHHGCLCNRSSGCRLCVARIRRIEKSRGTYLRLKHVHQQGLKSSGLTQYTLASEALDTARPCLHLLLQRLFGRKSWIPLVASFILEVLSTYIRAQGWKHLTPEEKKEHSARLRLLLLYLIRTPVWEAVTRKQLVVIIGFIRNYVPLARLFTGGVVDYADTMVDLHSFQWQTRL
eukprot:m.37452 g.37452  ORF g.37452 m.37452 type:complete len:212 (-) comp10093_c1_seq3:232-867(-)